MAAGALILKDLRSNWGKKTPLDIKPRQKLPHNLAAAAAGASLSVESTRGSAALGAGVGAGGGRRHCYLQQTFLSNNLEQMGARVPLCRGSISSPSSSSASSLGGEKERQDSKVYRRAALQMKRKDKEIALLVLSWRPKRCEQISLNNFDKN